MSDLFSGQHSVKERRLAVAAMLAMSPDALSYPENVVMVDRILAVCEGLAERELVRQVHLALCPR